MKKILLTLLALGVLLGGCVAVPPTPMQPAGAMGTFNDNTYFQHDVTVGGDVAVGGSLKVAATPVALLSGSAIDGASVKVAGTPVVVQVGALAAGARMVCGSQAITGTGTLVTGLATPQYVMASINSDVTGNGARISTTNASATVTVKIWNSALTPAAASTPQTVDWCVVGK